MPRIEWLNPTLWEEFHHVRLIHIAISSGPSAVSPLTVNRFTAQTRLEFISCTLSTN